MAGGNAGQIRLRAQPLVLLETLSGEISRQAHAGQRQSATVVGFFKGRNTAILRRMILRLSTFCGNGARQNNGAGQKRNQAAAVWRHDISSRYSLANPGQSLPAGSSRSHCAPVRIFNQKYFGGSSYSFWHPSLSRHCCSARLGQKRKSGSRARKLPDYLVERVRYILYFEPSDFLVIRSTDCHFP